MLTMAQRASRSLPSSTSSPPRNCPSGVSSLNLLTPARNSPARAKAVSCGASAASPVNAGIAAERTGGDQDAGRGGARLP